MVSYRSVKAEATGTLLELVLWTVCQARMIEATYWVCPVPVSIALQACYEPVTMAVNRSRKGKFGPSNVIY